MHVAHFTVRQEISLLGLPAGPIPRECRNSAARRGIGVLDLAATQVKRYLTGNGRATKSQMQWAVANVFGLSQLPEPNDVADALAMAYCGAGQLAQRREIPS